MTDAIKVSHTGLTQAERTVEYIKWMEHPAYSMFSAQHGEKDSIAQCTRKCNQAANSNTEGAQAFPAWLRDNLMHLSAQGIKVDLVLENGTEFSNTDTVVPSSTNRFKPAGYNAA